MKQEDCPLEPEQFSIVDQIPVLCRQDSIDWAAIYSDTLCSRTRSQRAFIYFISPPIEARSLQA